MRDGRPVYYVLGYLIRAFVRACQRVEDGKSPIRKVGRGRDVRGDTCALPNKLVGLLGVDVVLN